ncbi:MAG: EFR1 family ferrodoxin [Pseudomonadota bacterium]
MSKEIYYFSGTGNSLYIAKAIAEKTGATLIPIAKLKDCGSIKIEADIIGIVFPVYYMEPPMIILEFIGRLQDIKGKYIFAVSNYGGAAGESLRMLKKIIKTKGGELSAAYGIAMPQNSFPKPGEDRKNLYYECDKRIELIVNNTNNKKKGIFYTNPLMELAIIPIHALITRPICIKHFRSISNLPSDSSYEEHKHAMDRNFSTGESCNGCGICSQVCPAGNISIEDKKPVWLNHCEHCLACYNWCPNKAIRGGITKKDYYYHHPEIKLSEILDRR